MKGALSGDMAGKLSRAMAVAVIGTILLSALTACTPRDKPVSLSLQDGEPVVMYCGPAARLLKVVIDGVGSDSKDENIIASEEASMNMSSGQQLTLSDIQSWAVGDVGALRAGDRRLSVLLEIVSEGDGREQSILGSFDLAPLRQ